MAAIGPQLSPLEEGLIRGLLATMLGLSLYVTGMSLIRVTFLMAAMVAAQSVVSVARRVGWDVTKLLMLVGLVAIGASAVQQAVDTPTMPAKAIIIVAVSSVAFLQSGQELRWLVPFSLVPLAFSSNLQGHSGTAVAVAWVLLAGVALIAVDRIPHREIAVLRPTAQSPQQLGAQVPQNYYRLGAAGALIAAIVGIGLAPALGALTSDRLQSFQLGRVDYWGFDDNPDLLTRGGRTDRIVMWVSTDNPGLMRGRTYEAWDGRYWGSEVVTEQEVRRGVDGNFLLPSPDPTSGGVRSWSNVQTVTIAKGGTDLMFASSQAALATTASGDTVTWSSDGTLRADHVMGENEQYTVVSQEPVLDARTMQRSDPTAVDYNQGFRDAHLDTSAISPRVADLAEQITWNEPTAYGKMLAIERWFDSNFEYLLNSPVPPNGVDPIEYLLFENRQGYCEQIATAMVLMARSLGIPARLATGFTVYEFDARANQFVVRSKNAHAWADIYFPGVGWVGFDPTAGVELSAEELADQGDTSDPLAALSALTPALGVLMVLGVATAVGAGVWRLVQARRRRHARDWTQRTAHRLEQLGTLRGRPPEPQETLPTYAEALHLGPLPHDGLPWLATTLESAAFGEQSPDASTQAAAEAVLAELHDRLTPGERARLQFNSLVDA